MEISVAHVHQSYVDTCRSCGIIVGHLHMTLTNLLQCQLAQMLSGLLLCIFHLAPKQHCKSTS